MRNFKGASGLGVGIFILVLITFLAVGSYTGMFAGLLAVVPGAVPCDPLVTPNLLRVSNLFS